MAVEYRAYFKSDVVIGHDLKTKTSQKINNASI
jgi:hypothetical protein